MYGVIQSHDVLRNLGIIGSEFGLRCMLRCFIAVLLHEQTTFLDLALKPPRLKRGRATKGLALDQSIGTGEPFSSTVSVVGHLQIPL